MITHQKKKKKSMKLRSQYEKEAVSYIDPVYIDPVLNSQKYSVKCSPQSRVDLILRSVRWSKH